MALDLKIGAAELSLSVANGVERISGDNNEDLTVATVKTDPVTGGIRSSLVGGGVTCVLFGDSISYQNMGPGTGSPHQLSNYGYFTHLSSRLRGRLKLLANYAVVGSTLDAWVENQLPLVVTSPARIAITLLTGNNTVSFAGTTQAEIDAEITRQCALIVQIVSAVRASGKVLVFGTIPPRATSGGAAAFDTAGKRAVVAGVNRFALQIADSDPMVRVADMVRVLGTYDGTPRAGVHRDTPAVHPGAMGALLIADALYPAFAGIVSGDTIYTGAADTLLPSDISAWSANTSGTVTHTITHGVAGPDGLSDWSRQDVTAMAANGHFSQIYSPNITTGFAPGDTVAWSVECAIESLTNIRAVDCAIYVTATANLLASCMADYLAGTGISCGARDPIVLSHPGTVVPAGATSISFRLKIVATDGASVGSVLWRAPRLVKT